MSNYIIEDNKVILPDWEYESSKMRKITGTRLGAVCNINPWSTQFQAWCEITKTAKPPFVDTIYTIAGKTIEPKIIAWLKTQFGQDRVVSPAEYFEADLSCVFDFYPTENIFGGMWDALLLNKAGKPIGVFEIKTTKRVEDWLENPPLYYLAQAFLYARLLHVDKAIMVLCVMNDSDYDNPDVKIVDSNNTYTFMYDIDDKENVPLDIDLLMHQASVFWQDTVEKGVSPQFDEKKDEEYLKILRTTHVDMNSDIDAVLQSLNAYTERINNIRKDNDLDELEKMQSKLKEQLKELLKNQMSECDKYVELANWKLTKSELSALYDIKAYIKDYPETEEVLNKYLKTRQPVYKLTENKGDK